MTSPLVRTGGKPLINLGSVFFSEELYERKKEGSVCLAGNLEIKNEKGKCISITGELK